MPQPPRAARVLIVDDEKIISLFFRRLLETEGYTIQVEADGEAALRAIGEFKPDLIVLDVMMPKENGLRVSRKVKMLVKMGALRPTKILIATARDLSHDPDREQAMKEYSMADDFLYKPFRPGDLRDRVKALLKQGRQSHAAPMA